VLTQKADWKIALVGHDYSSVPLAQQQKVSQLYAEQLKAALQEKGVAAARIKTFGIGSLAPAGRGDRNARVEVVKVND
jgi:outer membrane protein OmpA-like peptidoglycan-associated protein